MSAEYRGKCVVNIVLLIFEYHGGAHEGERNRRVGRERRRKTEREKEENRKREREREEARGCVHTREKDLQRAGA